MLTWHETTKTARTAFRRLLEDRLRSEVEGSPQVHLAQGYLEMRRYVCPQHRDTCSCGKTRPADPLTSGHFSAVAIIMFICALGGLGKLTIWLFTAVPVLGYILGGSVLVVILAAVAGFAGIR